VIYDLIEVCQKQITLIAYITPDFSRIALAFAIISELSHPGQELI
jgi:hypothetical protein